MYYIDVAEGIGQKGDEAMKSINRELLYCNAVEGARAYLRDRCVDTLYQLVIAGTGAHRGKAALARERKGCTFFALYVADIIGNDDALYACFRMHEGMSKAAARPARLIWQDLLDAGIPANRIQTLFVNSDYSELTKGVNGTRSTVVERIACEWLGYRWTGGLEHSALYDHETGARLGRQGGRAVPDGVDALGRALEVKCVRGRTTYISDCK